GALFAPQPDLGLIVIDEEHEWTYKQQDSPPRYHAREAALELARLVGAVVVLGSATPDVESYHRAQRGEYELLELPERAALNARLPQVQIVDLRRELREGNRSLFSRALRQAMQEALEAGEQVILFLNRRGSATAVQCRSCGFVLRCRRCEVPLAYHSAPEVLLCHHCNQRSPVPRLCPMCFGPQLRFLGLGTQRAEEETAQAFPQARLLRWDRDVTQKRGSHEEIMERFLSHRADILIGTQMIAKGLDMPSVTLVGVLSADTGLHLPDLRAGERTFQILTQVAGRAGRGAAGGRVIIQTYTPEHYAILAAAQQDYRAFFKEEIERRRRHDYPPFSRLAHLLYTHTNAARCQQEAERMARLLRQERDARGLADLTVLGPTPAFAPRERGRYRWQVLVKGGDPPSLLAGIAWPKGWAVDIDPVSLL
ncbi:MAG: primosomal protein N', partial [Chloroflexota bacterium]|nr:primosomal protein N' [Chloroflexota bacterium]